MTTRLSSSIARFRRVASRPLFAALALTAFGCGEGFDPPSELRGLRVLGVHKNASYARPGDEITMNLVWQDASPSAPRDVQITWLPACINPEGNLYYGCFGDPEKFSAGAVSTSQEFRFQIPPEILDEVSAKPGNPVYGTAFAFFIACAGTPEVVLEDSTGDNPVPLACRGADGELLGPDDFVAGYTTVYVFEDGFTNEKPTITGFQVEGVDVPVDCLGADCAREGTAGLDDAEPIDCLDPAQSARCVATCEDDGEDECPEIDVRPLVDASTAERDEVAARYYDRNVGEQMWINYYVDRGGLRTPVRLLNDATEGWNDDYGMELFAPAEPGPFSVWAVTHDSRGGADFVRVRLQAETR